MSTSLFTKWWCGARGDGASSPAPAVRHAAGAEVPPVRYYSLDVLRGIAAFWVLLCHYPFSDAFRQALPRIVDFASFGHLGVQMFFVISGYCLAACAARTMNKRESTLSFLRRRLVRIYPPFWFSLAVPFAVMYVAALCAGVKQGRWVAPPPGPDLTLTGWVMIATLTRGLFIPGDAAFRAVNYAYWSLPVEVQFYLIVTCAVVSRRFYGALAAVTVLVLPFTFFVSATPRGLFFPWWAQFALGLALYYLLSRGITPERVLGRASLVVSAAVVCFLVPVSLMIFNMIPVIPDSGQVQGKTLFAILFAVALWFGHRFDPIVTRLRGARNLLVRTCIGALFVLGAMSYSIYLLHSNLLEFPRLIAKQVPQFPIAGDIAAIVCTCLLCYPFHRFCELPFAGSRQPKVTRGAARPDDAVAAGPETPGCKAASSVESGAIS